MTKVRVESYGIIPVGRVRINGIGLRRMVQLDKIARRRGCATLAEAVEQLLEELLDAKEPHS